MSSMRKTLVSIALIVGMMGLTGVKDYVHTLEDVFARLNDGYAWRDRAARRRA